MRSLVMVLVLGLLVTSVATAADMSCSHCGALNPVQAARCQVCGQQLGETKASSTPRATPLAKPSPSPGASPVVKASPSPRPATPSPVPERTPPLASVPPSPSPVAGPTATPAPVRSPSAAAPARPSAAAARASADEDGNLVIESSPAGASVSIGGRTIGHTPLRDSLKPGFYRVMVSASGRKSRRIRVRVRAGETTRKWVDLAADGTAPASESPAPPPEADDQAPSPRPVDTEWKGPTGTLVIELAHRGDATSAAALGVRIDDGPEGKVDRTPSKIATDLVSTYRYERTIRPGPHRVRVILLGVRADESDRSDSEEGTLEEVELAFDVVVSPGETTRLYHEWPGGIEEFTRRQPCCEQGHRPPR